MPDIAVTLAEDPEQALEKINTHDHDGTLGGQIPTDGIKDNAVTEPKIANQAVSTRTIQDGAVGRDQLTEEVNEMLSSGASEGVPGLTNYIANGLNITPGSGMSVNVSSGRASIAEKTVSLTTPETITMDARMASLIYAQKATDSDIPVIGKVDAAYWEPDDNTVAQWRFNLNGDVDVPNYAVGRSAIAIDNNLVHHGGLTRVDGWCDYAVKGDGSTGYYDSQNSTGFPIGAAARQFDVLYTHYTGGGTSGNQTILLYGTTTNLVQLYTDNTSALCFFQSAGISTGFTFEVGKTYLISMQYSDTTLRIFINGMLVLTTSITLTTTASVLYILCAVEVNRSKGVIHIVELRNKVRTPAQIAAIANTLLLPCFYTLPAASYPILSASDLASAYHEWKFDETSGTSIADSKGTLNGTATGAIIVDSPLGLGKARYFSATITDAVNCGNYSFPAEYTVVLIIKPAATGRSIIGNFNGSIGNAIQCDLDRTLKFYSNANTPSTANSRSTLNIGQNNFAAVSVGGGIADVYINSSNIDVSFSWIPNTSLSSNLQLGNNGVSSDSTNGVIDYVLIIPRYLAPAEISVIYNCLMGVIGDKDIRSILPANAISLGRVRSDADSIMEISKDYAIGRREKAVLGNRRQFLGWQYFNTGGVSAAPFTWKNPFGNSNVATDFVYTSDPKNYNRYNHLSPFYDFSVTKYGGLEIIVCNETRISARLRELGIANLTGYIQSGYIGCYAEVREND